MDANEMGTKTADIDAFPKSGAAASNNGPTNAKTIQ